VQVGRGLIAEALAGKKKGLQKIGGDFSCFLKLRWGTGVPCGARLVKYACGKAEKTYRREKGGIRFYKGKTLKDRKRRKRGIENGSKGEKTTWQA